MIDINPFCDSDIRNGLQFMSGVNLIFICICIPIDGLAIWEIEEYSETWASSTFFLPVYAGTILLCCDIFINLLQLICGWMLYSSVSKKTFRKINTLFYPSLAFFIIELGIIICYLVCIPSSPFFYYFTALAILFKAYLFWPMKKFINVHSQQHRPRSHLQPTERTRLLASAWVNLQVGRMTAEHTYQRKVWWKRYSLFAKISPQHFQYLLLYEFKILHLSPQTWNKVQ